MRKAIDVLVSVILLLVFIVACTLSLALVGFAGWLHTYNVFTQRTLVAEVRISETKLDEKGEYVDVTYIPYQQESALTTWLNPSGASAERLAPQNFVIYGDTVHIGGPIVKFYDHLIFLNFQTVYKVGKIYGRYNIDNDKELNRQVQSSYDLNDGIDPTWQDMNERVNDVPYSMFVDTTQLSMPGVFVSTQTAQTFNLYITNNGFLWEKR